MKILLIGEYSRVHLSLAEGLRSLGHEVVVASDGDGFKNYPRDIDLTRSGSGVIQTLSCMLSIIRKFSKFKGYDIVQLINPCFTTLNVRVNQYLYRQLRKNNKKVFLGAFGDDSYWVKACMEDKTFKYCEFFINGQPTNLEYNKKLVETWIGSQREIANLEMASDCNGIVACLYEYYKSYQPYFSDKLCYIPLPVNVSNIKKTLIEKTPDKVNFFIGINKDRSEYKGTGIMEAALLRLANSYPDDVIVTRVESVSYEEYKQLMAAAHVVLDQLYSYSPAMNALLAMAQGKVVVGGGEPEMYDLMEDESLRPIVNIYPTEEGVYNRLEWLVKNKSELIRMSREGREFVEEYHDHIKVARQYLDFWS